ncbi:hypothetical protein G7Y29_10215 [Corynebacterium qintianiae]|uniref:Uncharacterized protein n=1 Tax=Corynebacterium qintianiae TaxID=2709392 RepID=A0A7T0KMP0_9CORY|nr:hypothetical protein [Corynebacterium qintianiae]QPK83186.1 hypothetical protein G7Y29_10215 [Corynebacterium qintianiae]
MDFNAILAPAIEFSSEGIGKVLFDLAQLFYNIFYPANAEAAHPVEIPR